MAEWEYFIIINHKRIDYKNLNIDYIDFNWLKYPAY